MRINFTVTIFGFISGFLLLITGNTMNFWLSKYGASKEIIGLFSLVSLPYAINFLWAPMFDRVKLDFIKVNIDRRLKWILLLHSSGSLLVLLLSFIDPLKNTIECAAIAVLISFANASQDIVLNAYRTEIIPSKSQAKTSGLYIFGYRIGMIISGPIAIYLSEYLSFQKIYFLFFIIYSSFPLILILQNLQSQKIEDSNTIKDINFLYALREIGKPKIILVVLLFLVLYRLGDNFIGVMLNPFLLKIGFNEQEIALGGRLCGIAGSAFGGVVASQVMNNSNLINSLFWFGLLHSVAHLTYIGVEYSGPNIITLVLATIFDSVTGGMTMSAYIGLMTCMCKGKYRATQYSILSAMMGVSRSILPSMSGFILGYISWSGFFILSVILIFPALYILNAYKKKFSEILND